MLCLLFVENGRKVRGMSELRWKSIGASLRSVSAERTVTTVGDPDSDPLGLVADAVEALGVLVGELEQDNVRLHEYIDQRESLNEFRTGERVAVARTELESTLRRNSEDFDRRTSRLEEQMAEVVATLHRASAELRSLRDRVETLAVRDDDAGSDASADVVTTAALEERLRDQATELRTWVLVSRGTELPPPPPSIDLDRSDPAPESVVTRGAVRVSDLIGERSDFSGDRRSLRLLRDNLEKRDPA